MKRSRLLCVIHFHTSLTKKTHFLKNFDLLEAKLGEKNPLCSILQIYIYFNREKINKCPPCASNCTIFNYIMMYISEAWLNKITY